MLQRQSSLPQVSARAGLQCALPHSAAIHPPWRNHLLGALPREEYERLIQNMDPIELPQGTTIHGAGDARRYLYFLTSGIVSQYYVTECGESVGLVVTGAEGAIGVSSFLGGSSMPSQAAVLTEAQAYRLNPSALKTDFARMGPLARSLLRYTHSLITQTGQVAMCNRYHSVQQQLCRWMLSCLDRSPSNELTATQELIASMLGVRRESVTDAAGKLHRAGAIESHRGRIRVLDRGLLEIIVCECYAVLRCEHDHFAPEGPKFSLNA